MLEINFLYKELNLLKVSNNVINKVIMNVFYLKKIVLK